MNYSRSTIDMTIKTVRNILIVALFVCAITPFSASAQELGYFDTYGDNLGYWDSYGDNLGYWDSYGDNLGYWDSYGDNLGYWDSYGDNLGYWDSYGDNLGYWDSYGDNLGYWDSYGDNLGYFDTYGDNLGYFDTYPDVIDEYGSDTIYGYETVTDEYGTRYSYSDSFAKSYSMPTPKYFSAPGYSYTPPKPSYPSYPSYPSHPIITPTSNTYNSCVNNSCNVNNTNTNINNINTNTDNSINNSFNTNVAKITPVETKPVHYPVQYVYPQTQVSYIPPAPTPHVSLSQIPYTGFDLGPVGNAVYFGGLLAFAASLAYLALYYKGGASLVFAGIGARKTYAQPQSEVATPAMFGAKKEAPARSASLANLPVSESVVAAPAEMPKDRMVFKHSAAGEAPRIVITRN